MEPHIRKVDNSYRQERSGRHLRLLRLTSYWAHISILVSLAYISYRTWCNIDWNGSMSFVDKVAVWSFLGLEVGNIGRSDTAWQHSKRNEIDLLVY